MCWALHLVEIPIYLEPVRVSQRLWVSVRPDELAVVVSKRRMQTKTVMTFKNIGTQIK